MIPSEFAVHRSSTASRESLDDEDWYSFSSSIAGEGKTPKKSNTSAATSRRFRCLSTIGLPKRPDTKFSKQEISGRLRSSISRRCQQTRQSGHFFNVPLDTVFNGKRGNNSLKLYDPGSPDVSCLGRIKLKQKDGKGLRSRLKSLTSSRGEDRPQAQWSAAEGPQRRRFSWFKEWFTCRTKVDDSHRVAPRFDSSRREGDGSDVEVKRSLESESFTSCPPTLGHMKRFTSQREPQALSDFSAEDYDVEDSDSQQQDPKLVEKDVGMKKMEEKSRSDVGRIADVVGVYQDMDFGVCIPYPPPAEINLWKRRSVAPPVALDLKRRQLGLDMRKPMTV